MPTYQSQGGKKFSRAEHGPQVAKSLLVFLVLVGICIGIIVVSSKKPTPTTSSSASAVTSCSHVIPNSVFTTGDPLLDQRLLWTIVNDKDANKEVAGKIMSHIWEQEDFKFQTQQEQDLWTQANNAVTQITPIRKPSLSITADGTIVPFIETQDTASVMWTEVNVTDIPAKASTFFMSSALNGQKTKAIPVVLLSVNNGNLVPSPILGEGATEMAANTKEICDK